MKSFIQTYTLFDKINGNAFTKETLTSSSDKNEETI